MRNKTQEFIEKYNSIETLLSKLPDAPFDANMRWMEDNIDDVKVKNKMYLCRVTRNYIQHNPDYKSFIDISDGMLTFLDSVYSSVLVKINTVEKVMKSKRTTITKTLSDNVMETISLMSKKNIDIIPIVNESGVFVGTFDKTKALLLISNIKKNSTFKSIQNEIIKYNEKEILFVDKNMLCEDLHNFFKESYTTKDFIKMSIVTTTGTKDGCIIGIVCKEEFF